MKKIRPLMAVAALVLILISCSNSSQTKTADSSESATENHQRVSETSEVFADFYESFVSDKSFQMQRIQFPIKGSNITDYESEEAWSEENWSMLTHIDNIDTSDFSIEKNETSNRVEHKIYIPNSGFGVSYAFELTDGKWYLTERTDMNL
ncbi:MAG TPA: DUF4348 domain-containing protein [Bacteroidales bacterium]|nr:DUF4348 domain-containing protein [Bacteroidales bacterium]